MDQTGQQHEMELRNIVDRTKVLLYLAYFAGMLSNKQIRFGLSVEQFADTSEDMVTRGTAQGREHGPRQDGRAEAAA